MQFLAITQSSPCASVLQASQTSELLSLKIVNPEVQFQIVIDKAKPNPVEPTGAPQQILGDPLIGEEIDHRLKLQAENSSSTEWPNFSTRPVAVQMVLG